MKKPTKKLRFVKKDLHPLNEQQMRFLLGGDDDCTYGDCTQACTEGCVPESDTCPTNATDCFNSCGGTC